MRAERPVDAGVAPVLVLGLGNQLLADDGVGLELLRRVAARRAPDARVELVDGGTQGLALLGRLAGRRAVLVLDAVAHGSGPGVVHHLRGAEELRGARSTTAHEGNAGELFAAARLLGELPERVHVVGVEPDELCTRVGLSPRVQRALDEATALALRTLESLLAPPREAREPCTS